MSVRDFRKSHGLCVICETPVDSGTECERCKKKRSERDRVYYLKVKSEKIKTKREQASALNLCSRCGKNAINETRVCSICLEKQKLYYNNLKLQVYEKYGNVCSCCGESETRFLTIDHKNNDGAEHRKTVVPGRALYRWIVNNQFPSDFQILCFNCNCGRALNGGICPHKLKEVKQ